MSTGTDSNNQTSSSNGIEATSQVDIMKSVRAKMVRDTQTLWEKKDGARQTEKAWPPDSGDRGIEQVDCGGGGCCNSGFGSRQ